MKKAALTKEECTEVFISAYPNQEIFGDVHYNISNLDKDASASSSDSEDPQPIPPSKLYQRPEPVSKNFDTPRFTPLFPVTEKSQQRAVEREEIKNKPSNDDEGYHKGKEESVDLGSKELNISIMDRVPDSYGNSSAFCAEIGKKTGGESFLRGDTFGTALCDDSMMKGNTQNGGLKKGNTELRKLDIQNSITKMSANNSKKPDSNNDNQKVCAQCLVI